jgi:NADPH:quinone reductase-like Zn-dependent oxidoreductase
MKAAVLRECGQPPTYDDWPEPVPSSDGHVVVDVTAAAIVPLDLLCATGTSYFGVPATPYVPGVQGVGVMRDGDQAGTRVWFSTTAGQKAGDGSMAERAAVAVADLVPIPEGVSDATAAALGLSAVAGWLSLATAGELHAGDSVLVLGAGGTVGQVAVQAARLQGAGRVVAAARSAAARERALRHGADAVVDNSDVSDVAALTAEIAAACDGGPDLVLDPIFGPTATAASKALRPGGRLVNLGSASSEVATFDSATIRSRRLKIIGYTNTGLTPAEVNAALGAIFDHCAAGRIRVEFDQVPLSDVTEAWQRQRAGGDRRQVLIPSHS